MDKELVLKAIKELREKSKKRKFKQSFDFILNFKGINLKKGQGIDNFLVLDKPNGKKIKICALVDKELATQAKSVFDKVILKEEFQKFDKKTMKKLAKSYDFFIAQASVMVDIAKFFGKILGPRGKMPNPKFGGVVAAGANLKAVQERFQKMLRLQTKNELCIKVLVGKEDMKDEDIADNALNVYNVVVGLLPQEKSNIKSTLLKLTMSQAIEVR